LIPRLFCVPRRDAGVKGGLARAGRDGRSLLTPSGDGVSPPAAPARQCRSSGRRPKCSDGDPVVKSRLLWRRQGVSAQLRGVGVGANDDVDLLAERRSGRFRHRPPVGTAPRRGGLLPTTTPATTATRAIAATKDRENTGSGLRHFHFVPRVLGMLFHAVAIWVWFKSLCRIRLAGQTYCGASDRSVAARSRHRWRFKRHVLGSMDRGWRFILAMFRATRRWDEDRVIVHHVFESWCVGCG